jgi:methanogenic corrinoid protein MtbC1
MLMRGMMGDFGSRADFSGAAFSWQGASRDRKAQRKIASVPDSRKVRLAQTIEAEIIPRLMMAHQRHAGVSLPSFDPSVAAGAAAPAQCGIAEFAELVATRDAAATASYVVGLLEKGMTVEAVYLDLLAPAARHFGEQWDRDLCDFTDVGLGLTRLHQVMTLIGDLSLSRAPVRKTRRRALLVSLHNEMHNFGLFMVASLFRRANWDVFGWPLMTDHELVELVRGSPFQIVGISVTCAENLERARAAVSLIRKASRNASVKIMIGGPQFDGDPDAVAAIGADAASSDGLQAVEMANRLVNAAASPSWSC